MMNWAPDGCTSSGFVALVPLSNLSSLPENDGDLDVTFTAFV